MSRIGRKVIDIPAGVTVTVNEEKVSDVKTFYSYDDLKEGILVRKGKKKYARVTL